MAKRKTVFRDSNLSERLPGSFPSTRVTWDGWSYIENTFQQSDNNGVLLPRRSFHGLMI